jgi:hypothetical protein
MTQPVPGSDCWIEVEAVIFPDQVKAPDTYYGHGVGYGSYPPVDPEQLAPGTARYDALNNIVQVWNGTLWVTQTIGAGDEYVDLNTGVVYALTTAVT